MNPVQQFSEAERPGARYGHSRAYVEEVVARCGFALCYAEELQLRREGAEFLQGCIFVFQRR